MLKNFKVCPVPNSVVVIDDEQHMTETTTSVDNNVLDSHQLETLVAEETNQINE